MKSAPAIFLTLLAFTGAAVADLPKKAPITKYSGLWTNSPFTSKPPPITDAQAANPLEDYALGGISPIAGGYRVTLLNKKKPDERITVETDRPSAGFKILGVTRKPGDPLATVVRLSSGTSIGTVAFEEKLLTIAAAPTAENQNSNLQGKRRLPGQPPQLQPQMPPGQMQPGQLGQPAQPGQVQRQLRPRVVPPPTPQMPNQPQGQNNPRAIRR